MKNEINSLEIYLCVCVWRVSEMKRGYWLNVKMRLEFFIAQNYIVSVPNFVSVWMPWSELWTLHSPVGQCERLTKYFPRTAVNMNICAGVRLCTSAFGNLQFNSAQPLQHLVSLVWVKLWVQRLFQYRIYTI